MYVAGVSPGELSERYISTLNARDFESFRQLLADPLEYHALAGPVLTSADEVVASYEAAIEQMPPTTRIEIDHSVCDHEWAALEIWVVATETRADAAPRFAV